MRHTVYVFRCLLTGTYCVGVTTDLRAVVDYMVSTGRGHHLASPELLHLEQHDSPQEASYRLHQICRQWRLFTALPATELDSTLRIDPGSAGSFSLH